MITFTLSWSLLIAFVALIVCPLLGVLLETILLEYSLPAMKLWDRFIKKIDGMYPFLFACYSPFYLAVIGFIYVVVTSIGWQ